MKHLNNYILIMHLLKVPLEGLTSSCFITTKSTPIFSIQVDGLDIELFFYTQLSFAEWKDHFRCGLEVTFTAFMDPFLVYRGTTPSSCLIITFLAMVHNLLFNRLFLMSHNVVMNPHIPLLTAYTHISLRIA